VKSTRYQWAARGDVNAFLGLSLDNIAGMVLAIALLLKNFQFPAEFALHYMIPGTAIGVLVGDILYFLMAFGLARRTGRSDITAMPLGLDTPSTIGMVLFVIGPAYQWAIQSGKDGHAAAMEAWHIGICALFMTGLIKLALSIGATKARQWIPRAGLLGSLSAIALVLIAFVPFVDVASVPIVGLASLAMIFVTLVGRTPLPGKLPGVAGAVIVGCAIYYLLWLAGYLSGQSFVPQPESSFKPYQALLPTQWLSVFDLHWFSAMGASLHYLPYVIPFAITTVIGGIDCTESAAAAGDEYPVGLIIGVEAVATMIASLCGGVIQTTPYIGHPAYKAMGGRALYTLLAALFVGGAGLLGYFGYMYVVLPKAVVFPILIFIGLEITAQTFHATPRRHYAALALACIPAMARLVTIILADVLFDPALTGAGINPDSLLPSVREKLSVLGVLSAGFILTSLLWASALAKIIDRRWMEAARYCILAGVCASFGLIHSPLPGDRMYLPWNLETEPFRLVLQWTLAYGVAAALLFVLGLVLTRRTEMIDSDEAYEKLTGL
jgi:AGZA family xanthine/uracil permease-like MFS transporter